MNWYLPYCDQSLIPQTRVHRLNHFSTSPENPLKKEGYSGAEKTIFTKREDETGFAISGGKKRKYASLLPFLLKNGHQSVVLGGSAASNNIAGLAQLLIENNIKPILLLKRGNAPVNKGNLMLTSLLVPETQIIWLEREEWKKAETIARLRFPDLFWIPEGACCAQALPGAMTLIDDIQRNENEIGLHFDHIFIDSGTGLSAGALVLGNSRRENPAQIHIVLCAGDEGHFKGQLALLQKWKNQFFPENQPLASSFNCYYPATAKSFGSVNQTVLSEIQRMAREEGILTDPVYSAKVFYTVRQLFKSHDYQGNSLIIHSGGCVSLFG